jgi:hypothetical protein
VSAVLCRNSTDLCRSNLADPVGDEFVKSWLYVLCRILEADAHDQNLLRVPITEMRVDTSPIDEKYQPRVFLLMAIEVREV